MIELAKGIKADRHDLRPAHSTPLYSASGLGSLSLSARLLTSPDVRSSRVRRQMKCRSFVVGMNILIGTRWSPRPP